MRAHVYVANLLPVDVARIATTLSLSGTVHEALGFGEWGIEPTTVVVLGNVELAGLVCLLLALFFSAPEEAAIYVELDDKSGTVYRSDNIVDYFFIPSDWSA